MDIRQNCIGIMAATECFAHGLKEELQSARVFYIRLFQKTHSAD